MALWDNIVGKWALNNTLADTSGNGNTLVATESFEYGMGQNSSVRSSARLTDSPYLYVDADVATELKVTGALTISAWVYFNSLDASQGIAGIWNSGSAERSYLIYIDSSNNITFYISYDGTSTNARYSRPASSSVVVGAWYHIVGIFDPSQAAADRLKLYINNADVGVQSAAYNYTTIHSPSSSNFNAGAFNEAAEFDGLLSDVAVWDVVLSPSEVSELYALGDNFGVTTDTLWTKIRGLWPLNNNPVTTQYSYDGLGKSLTHVDTPTLTTGHGYHAAGGITNGASVFDGTSQRYYRASEPHFEITSDLTLAAWIYPEKSTFSSDENIIGKGNITTNTIAYRLYISDSNKISFAVSANGTAETVVTANAVVAANTWYHAAALYDSENEELRLYINGVEQTSKPAFSSDIYKSTNYLIIGACSSGGYFDGRIQDAGIWARVLSSTEITKLYDMDDAFITHNESLWTDLEARWPFVAGSSGSMYDTSGNDITLTRSGGATTSYGFEGRANGSQLLNGTTGYFYHSSALAITGALTISIRVRTGVLGARANTEYVWSKWDSSGNQRGYVLYINTSGYLIFAVSSDGTGASASKTSTQLLPATETMITCVHDPVADELQLYINGVLDSPAVSYSDGINAPSTAFRVGLVGSSSAGYFEGRIDDLVVWSRALSSTEISDFYLSKENFYLATEPEINVTSISQYQIFQRNISTNQGDIYIPGTTLGSPTAIEASFNGGSFVTIDSSPADNAFSGTLTNQASGQGDLVVRFTNDTDVSITIPNVGIGDKFLPIGQSNGSGRLTNPQTYSSTDGFKAVMYTQAKTGWAELTDPTDPEPNAVGKGSFWPLLATLIMNDQHVPVGFVTTADGSTALVADGSANHHWQPGDDTYEDCVSTVDNSGSTEFLTAIWDQGEADALGSVAATSYSSGLQALRTNLISDFANVSALKIITNQLGNYIAGGASAINAIREGQWDAASTDANIYHGAIRCDIDLTGGDSVHYKTDAEGQVNAERMFQAIKRIFYSGSEGRGPVFNTAIKISSQEIVINFTTTNAPLQSISTDGWLVTDSVGTLSLSSIATGGVDRILLTVGRGLDTNPKISWGYGFDSSGLTFRDSSVAYGLGGVIQGLPPEPFIEEDISSITIPAKIHHLLRH